MHNTLPSAWGLTAEQPRVMRDNFNKAIDSMVLSTAISTTHVSYPQTIDLAANAISDLMRRQTDYVKFTSKEAAIEFICPKQVCAEKVPVKEDEEEETPDPSIKLNASAQFTEGKSKAQIWHEGYKKDSAIVTVQAKDNQTALVVALALLTHGGLSAVNIEVAENYGTARVIRSQPENLDCTAAQFLSPVLPAYASWMTEEQIGQLQALPICP